ncbi:MAG: sulfotransferase [Candidatus Omnitrophica bacterium]|nr:sulfotransferase [Candidatus Omnitrophota bacterium]
MMFQKSHLLKHEDDRSKEFKPNPKLVNLITELKQILEPVQEQLNQKYQAPKYPVVVVVGNARSGTTVLTQILSATDCFSYPTNFLSRLAYAPWIGAMIQQMLFNPAYDFHGELNDIQSASGFTSLVGKTRGALGINEFFHFWRKFFPNYDPGYIPDEFLEKVDVDRMRSELASIESVFNKPFMSKGMMMQYNVAFFAEKLPELFFIHIKRDPSYVMQSVMMSRKKFYGTDQIWWSVKPKEYDLLSEMPPIYQVAGQVLYTMQAIERGLSVIDKSRKMICSYENLCENPKKIFKELQIKLAKYGCPLTNYNIKRRFECQNKLKIPEEEFKALEAAYEELKSND